jgi:predicted permease
MAGMETVIAAVVPVMLMALLGYVLARMGRPVEGESLRFVIVHIGTPALIFTALLKNDLTGAALAGYTAAAVAALALFALVGWCLLRLNGLSIRAFLPSMIFANTGNLGLPIALYACGPAGLGYAAVLHSISTVGNVTLGQSMAIGSADWKSALKSPALLAALLGLAVSQFHVTLPLWLRNTLELPGGFTIPLMLMMLGSSLATIEVHSIRRTVALSALRIGMGIAVGYALAWAFGLTGVPRAVFVLQAAMPVAVYNYLFALVGKTDPQGVASIVVVSTLIAAITIPVLLIVLL